MIKVRAISKCEDPHKTVGIFGNRRMRRGDVFFIKSEKQFSEVWMERVKEEVEPVDEKQASAERERMAKIGLLMDDLEKLSIEDLKIYAKNKNVKVKENDKKEKIITKIINKEFPEPKDD